jgi:hypothetical protein
MRTKLSYTCSSYYCVLHRVGYYRHGSPLAIPRNSIPITVITTSTILVLVTIAIEIILCNRASLHSGKLLTVIGTVTRSMSTRTRCILTEYHLTTSKETPLLCPKPAPKLSHSLRFISYSAIPRCHITTAFDLVP